MSVATAVNHRKSGKSIQLFSLNMTDTNNERAVNVCVVFCLMSMFLLLSFDFARLFADSHTSLIFGSSSTSI